MGLKRSWGNQRAASILRGVGGCGFWKTAREGNYGRRGCSGRSPPGAAAKRQLGASCAVGRPQSEHRSKSQNIRACTPTSQEARTSGKKSKRARCAPAHAEVKLKRNDGAPPATPITSSSRAAELIGVTRAARPPKPKDRTRAPKRRASTGRATAKAQRRDHHRGQRGHTYLPQPRPGLTRPIALPAPRLALEQAMSRPNVAICTSSKTAPRTRTSIFLGVARRASKSTPRTRKSIYQRHASRFYGQPSWPNVAERASNTASRTRISTYLAKHGRTHFHYHASYYNEQLPGQTWPNALPILRLVLERATSWPNVAERTSHTASRATTSNFLAQRGRTRFQYYASYWNEQLPGPTLPNALPILRLVLERAASWPNVAERTSSATSRTTSSHFLAQRGRTHFQHHAPY